MGRMHGQIKTSKGFTFVETLVTVIILSIIMVPIASLYYDTHRDYIISQRKLDLQFELNKTMKLVLDDLKKAGSKEAATYASIERDSAKTSIAVRYYAGPEDPANFRQITYCYDSTDNAIYRYQSSTPASLDDTNIANTINSVKTSGQKIFEGQRFRSRIQSFTVEGDMTKINNGINDNDLEHFKVLITVQPDNIGSHSEQPMVLTSDFVPRFNMDIR